MILNPNKLNTKPTVAHVLDCFTGVSVWVTTGCCSTSGSTTCFDSSLYSLTIFVSATLTSSTVFIFSVLYIIYLKQFII